MPWRFWQMLGLALLKNRIFKNFPLRSHMGNFGKTKMRKFRKRTKHIRFHNFHHFCFGTGQHLANWESQICWEPKTGTRTSFVGSVTRKNIEPNSWGKTSEVWRFRYRYSFFFWDYTLIDEQDDSRYIDELL